MNDHLSFRIVADLVMLVGIATAACTTNIIAQQPEAVISKIKDAWSKRQESVRSARIQLSLKETTPKGAIGKQLPPPLTVAGDIQPPEEAVHEGACTLLLDG